MITQARLKELLSYDPETGVFINIGRRSPNVAPGKPAGSIDNKGYRTIMVDRQRVLAHRLVFVYLGEDVPKFVDHVNGDRADNRRANLRGATARGNAENRRRPQGSNPLLGTFWNKARRKWQAKIKVDGRALYLGCFDTAEEAHQAYLAAKRELHEGCTI